MGELYRYRVEQSGNANRNTTCTGISEYWRQTLHVSKAISNKSALCTVRDNNLASQSAALNWSNSLTCWSVYCTVPLCDSRLLGSHIRWQCGGGLLISTLICQNTHVYLSYEWLVSFVVPGMYSRNQSPSNSPITDDPFNMKQFLWMILEIAYTTFSSFTS